MVGPGIVGGWSLLDGLGNPGCASGMKGGKGRGECKRHLLCTCEDVHVSLPKWGQGCSMPGWFYVRGGSVLELSQVTHILHTYLQLS